MRVEPYGVGSFVHAMKRGARGLPITRHVGERWRFARLLYFLNDEHRDENWERNTADLGMFTKPPYWPDSKPLTRILAWVLMPNHFHLLLEEITEGGISTFMQRLCGSMTTYANAKYKERGKGSIFQGGYKGKTVDSDAYLRQLVPYIMVKNVFELYPGGYAKAVKEFDTAYNWALNEYPFSSLHDYGGKSDFLPIVDRGLAGELFPTPKIFKSHARDVIQTRGGVKDVLNIMAFED